MSVFWDIAPCRLVGVDRRFRGSYCLYHQGTLTMEAVRTSDMSNSDFRFSKHKYYMPICANSCNQITNRTDSNNMPQIFITLFKIDSSSNRL
jgi:hypothetical protein